WGFALAHPGALRLFGCSTWWAQSTSCTQSTKAKSAWALPPDRWERRFSSRQSLSRRYSLRMGSYFGCCCGQSNEAAHESGVLHDAWSDSECRLTGAPAEVSNAYIVCGFPGYFCFSGLRQCSRESQDWI